VHCTNVNVTRGEGGGQLARLVPDSYADKFGKKQLIKGVKQVKPFIVKTAFLFSIEKHFFLF